MYHVRWKYVPFIFIVDAIGYSLFFWRKLVSFRKKSIRRVLIIRLDHIGDVLLTTPVIRALHHGLPAAKIDMLVRPFTKGVIETNSNINKIHVLNPPWFNREPANFIGLIRFVFKNFFKYDLVVELHADPRNIILASLVGKYIIGYDIRGFGFLLNKTAVYAAAVKHIIERNLDVVRSIGMDSSSKIDIVLTEKDIAFADKLLGVHSKVICLVPSTGRVNKFWYNPRWAVLADYLARKYDAKIIFLGGKEDAPLITGIIKQMKSRNGINLADRTSLRESAAIINKSMLLICPDTGMMHAAKAVGTPCIALFGPVNPKIWGYDDKQNKSVFAKLPCSFCDAPVCWNKKKALCMKSISVATVVDAVAEIVSLRN